MNQTVNGVSIILEKATKIWWLFLYIVYEVFKKI
jgi:hypothetical protein